MGVCWPDFSQRGQQAPLPCGMADSQMLPAPVELVKLQLHGRLRDSVWGKPGTGLSRRKGKCAGTLVESTGYARNWSFAERTRSAPITPMKSAPWAPELVFREVPGKSVQRGGQPQWFRRGCVLRRALLNPAGRWRSSGFRRRQLAWVFCRRAAWHSGLPQAC